MIREVERQRFVFDARPSDGIALAARVECPITVTDEVLDAAGHPTEAFQLETGSGSDIDFDDRLTGGPTRSIPAGSNPLVALSRSEGDGYREMIDAAENGDVEAVVVHEISRLARSLQDLDRTVDHVTDAGVEFYFVRDIPQFSDEDNPMTRLQMQMLGVFAVGKARVKQINTHEGIAARQSTDENYHHGRAPLGFEKEQWTPYRGKKRPRRRRGA